MGPSVSIRFRGLLLRVPLMTPILFWVVVTGVTSHLQHTFPTRIAVALSAGCTILLVIALHEVVRVYAYGKYGVGVRGLDLLLVGSAPRLTEKLNRPRTEVTAGLASMVCIATIATGFFAVRQRLPVNSPVHGYFNVTGIALVGIASIQILPALPLDGGRLFRALVWHLSDDPVRGSRGAAVYGHIISAAMIGGGAILLIQPGMWPYWGLGLLVAGLQIIFVTAASLRDTFCQQQGESLPLGGLVIPWSRRVDASSTIEAAIEKLVLEADGPPLLVISESGQPIGLLRSSNLRRTKRSQWAGRIVEEIMTPLAAMPEIREDTTVLGAMLLIEESRVQYAAFRDSQNHIRFIDRTLLEKQLYEANRHRRPGQEGDLS